MKMASEFICKSTHTRGECICEHGLAQGSVGHLSTHCEELTTYTQTHGKQ